MPQFNFVISVADKETSMLSTDIRKREGDIITVKEPGKNYGWKVIDEYLIVPVNVVVLITKLKAEGVLKRSLYENGKVDGIDFRDINPDRDGVDKESGMVWDIKAEKKIAEPKRLAKNRYQIPLTSLGDIDLEKTRDIKTVYQPFLKESFVVNMPCFTLPDRDIELRYVGGVYEMRQIRKWKRNIYEETINGKLIRFIRPKEPAIPIEIKDDPWRPIYCDTSTIGKEDEKVFEWSTTENLVKDKHDNSWLEVSSLGQ